MTEFMFITSLGQNVFVTVFLCSSIFSCDLVKMSADNDVCPPVETACDKVRETLPITTGKLFKGDNRHNSIRVGRDKADERFEVGLRSKVRREPAEKEKSYILETFPDTLVVIRC